MSRGRFWALTRADADRYGRGSSRLRLALTMPGYRFLLLLRACRATRDRTWLWPLHPFCRWAASRTGIRFGIQISYDTELGAGFYIGHWGGIVVHPRARFGRNCNLNHGVTVGEKFGGKKPGVPAIGDEVYLGPGAVVIGGITVGDRSAIGANAVVTSDVPPGAVMIGAPAKPISLRGSGDYIAHRGSV